MTFRKSTICHHQPRAAVSNHWTPLAIAPQPRGGLDFPEGLNDPLPHWLQWTSAEARATITRRCSICNPSYPRAGGTHLCYLDPLAEAGREGSSPTSPSIQKCYPRTLQGLCRCLLRESLCPPPPLQSMGSCHRSPPQHQTPQRKDIPPLAREPFGLAQYGRITGRSAQDAVLAIVHDIEAAWNHDCTTTMLTIDITGFFNTIPHSYLHQQTSEADFGDFGD